MERIFDNGCVSALRTRTVPLAVHEVNYKDTELKIAKQHYLNRIPRATSVKGNIYNYPPNSSYSASTHCRSVTTVPSFTDVRVFTTSRKIPKFDYQQHGTGHDQLKETSQ